MTKTVTGETIAALSALSGQPFEPETAARVARAIGPALAVFSQVEATLPFEAEPANFVCVQHSAGAPS